MASPPEPATPPIQEGDSPRFRLRLTPTEIAEVLGIETKPRIITVEYRRRLLTWTAAIGWLLAPAACVLGIYLMRVFGLQSQTVLFALQFPPMYAAMMATLVLTQRNLLTYDVDRRKVWSGTGQIRRALGRWRPGDRLEYSIYRGRLERVRPSGRRRIIARFTVVVDHATWAEFVDVFRAHQIGSGGGGEPSDLRAPVVKVGIRWRFFSGFLLAGLVTEVFALWPRRGDFDSVGSLHLAAAGYFLFGALPLLLRPVLTYKEGRVSVKSLGRPAREYPSPGFERLEFSVYTGCLYEVRADGKRRKIARGWARDLDSWKVFVDRFLADAAKSAR
ncbi:hypothetical protein GCM10009853_020620 [Glycomyces scopariae]